MVTLPILKDYWHDQRKWGFETKYKPDALLLHYATINKMTQPLIQNVPEKILNETSIKLSYDAMGSHGIC